METSVVARHGRISSWLVVMVECDLSQVQHHPVLRLMQEVAGQHSGAYWRELSWRCPLDLQLCRQWQHVHSGGIAGERARSDLEHRTCSLKCAPASQKSLCYSYPYGFILRYTCICMCAGNVKKMPLSCCWEAGEKEQPPPHPPWEQL